MKRLIVAILAGILIVAFLLAPQKSQEPEQKTAAIELAGEGMADANLQRIAFFQINTNTQTAMNSEVSWQIFAQPIPKDIYELDGPKIEATQYTQFHKELAKQFKTEGKTLSSVTLQNLEALPTESFLLIPSGILQETMLQDGILEKLIEKNTTILYIGLPFDVTLGPDGAPNKNKALWQNFTKKLGFEYTETDQTKPKNHSFSKSQYGIRLNTENNATRIYINDATIYSASYQNQGTLSIIPNTIDNGWQNGTQAADDLVEIIKNGQWQPQLAGQTTTQLLKPGQNTLVSPPFDSASAFAQVKITSKNTTYRFSAQIHELVGRQNNPKEAAPGQTITLAATLYADFTRAKQFNLTIQAKLNGDIRYSYPTGMATVKTIGFASTTFNAPIEPGDYLLELKDQDNQIHAQSLLHVTNMTARFIREDYGDGAFSVQILKDGQPEANTPYRISLDGANNKTLTTDENGIASFNTRSSIQPTHILSFFGPDHFFQIQRPHIDAGFLNSPLAYGVIFLILAIFGFGYFFAVKTKTKYYIDIPEFTPQPAQTRIIQQRDVIHAFETANQRFHRQYGPLTLQEVKDALKESLELPNRTTLTDSNIQTLLYELEKQEIVKTAHGFFVLTTWEKKTGKKAEFLILKRMVTDELIKNGQPFQETPKDALKTKSATYHFFESENLSNFENRLEKNKSFLVFPTHQDVHAFVQQLRTNSESLYVRLYLEMTHGTFHAICVEQIGKESK